MPPRVPTNLLSRLPTASSSFAPCFTSASASSSRSTTDISRRNFGSSSTRAKPEGGNGGRSGAGGSGSGSRLSPAFTKDLSEIFSSFSGSKTPAGGPNASRSNTEAMFRELKSNEPAQVTENRTIFHSKRTIMPIELSHENLYIDRRSRPFPKPPLFGPPASEARKTDPFVLSNTTPIEQVYNPIFVQSFLDPMGKIKPRSETMLTKKSQRGVGKMVRRARAMGLIGIRSARPSRGGYGIPPGRQDIPDDTL